MNTPFLQIKNALASKPRQGYLKRGVSIKECETIWDHSNTSRAVCYSHITGSPGRIDDKVGFTLMGFGHDWIEHDMPDYTPSCDISLEEKSKLENESLERLRRLLGKKYFHILDKVQEYNDGASNDAQEMFYIDKSLAGVGGLEYERQGYTGMDDFHPYALDKLSTDNFHTRVYEILLEREFTSVDFFIQYNLLLRLAGDYDAFRREVRFFS